MILRGSKLSERVKRQTSETIEIGIFLALAGGFMDAYSYLCRGKVFANAQTGNMLLLGIKLTEGDIKSAFKYIMPVLAFTLGIFISDTVRYIINKGSSDNKKLLHWRQYTLLIEISLLLSVCFIPQEYNIIANSITSMACGMQVESFRKIHGNGIATTMCIGNLRSGTENLYSFFKEKSKTHLRKAGLYYFIILCFIIGAVLGNICIDIFKEKSMVVCVLFLFVGFMMMFKKEWGKVGDC